MIAKLAFDPGACFGAAADGSSDGSNVIVASDMFVASTTAGSGCSCCCLPVEGEGSRETGERRSTVRSPNADGSFATLAGVTSTVTAAVQLSPLPGWPQLLLVVG